ncbi:MAG: adenylate/guanylate cyclase domain-containing protein, partial [Bacteroidota bacterium]
MSAAGNQGSRKLAAIMFTDIKGFSRKMGENESVAMALLKAHDAMMHELVSKYGGMVIKSIGDSFMVDFSSAVNAVKCAIEAQEIFWYYNIGKPDLEKIEIRVGIHLGDVITDGKDIFGDGVNIAARIESITAPTRICISSDIYSQIRNKMQIRVHSMGPMEFKNIAEKIEIYEVLMDSVPELSQPSQPVPQAPSKRKVEAETRREAKEAERVEAAKPKIDEQQQKAEQDQQRRVQEYFQRAEQHFKSGNFERAQEEIREIFKIVAIHPQAQMLEAKIEEERFHKEEAKRLKDDAEHKKHVEREQEISTYLFQARAAFEQNRFEDARVLLLPIYALEPDNEEAKQLEEVIEKAVEEASQAHSIQEAQGMEEAEKAEAEEQAIEDEKVAEEVEHGPREPVRRPSITFRYRPSAARKKSLIRAGIALGATALGVILLISILPSLRTVLFPRSSAIAVLSFQMESSEGEEGRAGEAIAALLAEDLARRSGLTVVAPTTAVRYRSGTDALARVAEELQVRGVISGDLQKRDTGWIVRVRLTNADDQSVLWNGSYELPHPVAGTWRSEAALHVFRFFRLDTTAIAPQRFGANPEVVERYLRNRWLIDQRSREAVDRGIDSMKLLIALDSGFSPA